MLNKMELKKRIGFFTIALLLIALVPSSFAAISCDPATRVTDTAGEQADIIMTKAKNEGAEGNLYWVNRLLDLEHDTLQNNIQENNLPTDIKDFRRLVKKQYLEKAKENGIEITKYSFDDVVDEFSEVVYNALEGNPYRKSVLREIYTLLVENKHTIAWEKKYGQIVPFDSFSNYYNKELDILFMDRQSVLDKLNNGELAKIPDSISLLLDDFINLPEGLTMTQYFKDPSLSADQFIGPASFYERIKKANLDNKITDGDIVIENSQNLHRRNEADERIVKAVRQYPSLTDRYITVVNVNIRGKIGDQAGNIGMLRKSIEAKLRERDSNAVVDAHYTGADSVTFKVVSGKSLLVRSRFNDNEYLFNDNEYLFKNGPIGVAGLDEIIGEISMGVSEQLLKGDFSRSDVFDILNVLDIHTKTAQELGSIGDVHVGIRNGEFGPEYLKLLEPQLKKGNFERLAVDIGINNRFGLPPVFRKFDKVMEKGDIQTRLAVTRDGETQILIGREYTHGSLDRVDSEYELFTAYKYQKSYNEMRETGDPFNSRIDGLTIGERPPRVDDNLRSEVKEAMDSGKKLDTEVLEGISTMVYYYNGRFEGTINAMTWVRFTDVLDIPNDKLRPMAQQLENFVRTQRDLDGRSYAGSVIELAVNGGDFTADVVRDGKSIWKIEGSVSLDKVLDFKNAIDKEMGIYENFINNGKTGIEPKIQPPRDYFKRAEARLKACA